MRTKKTKEPKEVSADRMNNRLEGEEEEDAEQERTDKQRDETMRKVLGRDGMTTTKRRQRDDKTQEVLVRGEETLAGLERADETLKMRLGGEGLGEDETPEGLGGGARHPR